MPSRREWSEIVGQNVIGEQEEGSPACTCPSDLSLAMGYGFTTCRVQTGSSCDQRTSTRRSALTVYLICGVLVLIAIGVGAWRT
jgi:hypothetical protein